MITTAILMFLFGTLVSAGSFIPSHIVNNEKSSVYYPILLSSEEGDNVIKPQIVQLSAFLPHQLQHLITAIKKDDCQKSLPIVTPFIVKEFIKEPIKFVQALEIRAAPLISIPIADLNQKPLVIPEPPKLDLPEYIMEYKEPRKPSVSVVIPPAPKLPPIKLTSLVKEVQVISEVPCERPVPSNELPKMPVLVEEITDFIHHVTLPLNEQEDPLVIPEAPKLPELSIKDIEKIKNNAPEYVVVIENKDTPKLPSGIEVVEIIPEPPSEQPRPFINLPPFSEVDEEIPSLKPYQAFEIEESKPLIIPEAPKLPELSVHVLEQIKEKIPEYVDVHEEPIIPSIAIAIPPAPQLPQMNLPDLPSFIETVEFIPQVPWEHRKPTFIIETKELKKPSEAVSPTPVEDVKIITELPCKHTRPLELPKLPMLVDETPALKPYEILEIKENKPLIIPEPPKLPELSVEDLDKLKGKVPEYVFEKEEVEVPSVLLVNSLAPQMLPTYLELPKLPMLVDESPALKPYEILEIKENKPLVIPEAPKLPELSVEDLEELKYRVPEYVIEKEEPEVLSIPIGIPLAPQLPPMRQLELPSPIPTVEVIAKLPCESPKTNTELTKASILVEDIPAFIIPEPPKFQELSVIDLEQLKHKIPANVVEKEESKEPSVSVLVPPAPSLPPMEFQQLPSMTEELQIFPGLPIEFSVESKVPEPILVEIERPKIPLNSLLLSPAHTLTSEKAVKQLSIPNYYFTKKCVDEIVLNRIIPKIGV